MIRLPPCPVVSKLHAVPRKQLLANARLRVLRLLVQWLTALSNAPLLLGNSTTQAGISVDTAFGDPRLGSAGEYSDALRKGTSVNLLLTEVTGARHAHAERFLRLCASAHAARFPHLVDSPATLSFYALHSTLLSVACLRGLGEQLRSRIVSSVSRASLRRRAPAGLCAPAPF
ncbi:hypothetical protein AB1Y20_005126 [Prymnesium parvum]|uniref:Uncharacterized protein n=1 Tax=Prymnesium parvum TaxID=97485 RepID=A0AB34J4F4_PRYPA